MTLGNGKVSGIQKILWKENQWDMETNWIKKLYMGQKGAQRS